MSHRPWLVSAIVVVLPFVAGCHHAEPPVVAPAAVVESKPDDSARRDSIARAENARRLAAAREQARADSIRMANERRAAEARMAEARAALTAKVFFQYDQSELSNEARGQLDAKASVLKSNPDVHIRIDGNADERGSDEYNMALGMRRATTSKRYLTDKGIDAGRVDVVSNGEEQPVCKDHAESCWSQNRRDEFVITAGGVH